MKNTTRMSILETIKQLPKRLGMILIPDLSGPRSPRSGDIILPLHGYSQLDDYSCAVSAGWAALEFLRPAASLRKFNADCAPSPIWGSSTASLASALRKSRVKVGIRKLSRPVVQDSIQRGRPVLACIKWGDIWHWICISGFNRGRVFMTGRPTAGFSKFSYTWKQLLADGRACPALVLWNR